MCVPLLSCTRQASCGTWLCMCPSCSYPRRSRWLEEPSLVRGQSLYHPHALASDWALAPRSHWPTARFCPGLRSLTWSSCPMTACAQRASQSSGGGWCARVGTGRFWVCSVGWTPPLVTGIGHRVTQDGCRRSWEVKVVGSRVSKGRCPQRYWYLPAPRKVQPGRLSCSTQSCWSWLNMVALGSRGCHLHYPPVRCLAHCSSPEYQVCIGMLSFCRGKTHKQVFLF